MVTFDVSAFVSDLDALESDLQAEAFAGWKRAVHEAADSTNEYGYQNKSGALTGTRDEIATGSGFSYIGSIRWGMYYSRWVDEGRGPVRPIRARCLRWYVGGRPVFRMYAGPSRPAHFSQHAREHFAEHASQLVQQGVDRAIASH